MVCVCTISVFKNYQLNDFRKKESEQIRRFGFLRGPDQANPLTVVPLRWVLLETFLPTPP